MNLNVQTIFWLDAFLYLMLHVAILYGLSRFRSPVVLLWSASGIYTALGLCVLGSGGWVSTDVVVVAGQFLMVAGNWGRQAALRSLSGPTSRSWIWMSGALNLGFLALSYSLHFSGAPESTLMLLFYSYFSLNCLEYYFSGRRIALTHDSKGAASVKWAGLILTVTLGIKALAMLSGVGATDLYATSWDNILVFVGQFVAILMMCVGFMQIFVDHDHRTKMSIEHQLAREQERAASAQQHASDMGFLLAEREEIIRQLTLSNKSAGMGALVASFAHELNQPLTANLLHAELIQAQMMAAMQGAKQPDLKTLHAVAEAMVSDTQRAADIIRKLRNLFRMSKGEYSPLNLESLVHDVLDLVRSKLNEADIMLTTEFDKNLLVNGDQTQLQQVVLNLLNNAIDAMVDGRARYPHLRLSAKAVGQYIDLQVQDNGKGVDPSHMEDVFSLFKTSKLEGMGVGLWLSRSIVETHGGRLTFESEPGHRTVFTLRLPCLAASPTA